MDQHEFGQLLTPLTEEGFDGLKADIRLYGLRDPIVVYEGKIVDGWHRYGACIELGIEPVFVEWDEVGSLIDFVASKNIHRRHLTPAQVLAVMMKIDGLRADEAKVRRFANLKRGTEKPHSERNSPNVQKCANGKTVAETAKKAGASTRQAAKVREVAKKAPEKLDDIANKTKSIGRAHAEMKAEEKAKAAPAKEPPKDGLGRSVAQEHMWEAFRSTEHQEICNEIQRIKKRINALIATPLGKGIHHQGPEPHLSSLYFQVKNAKPYIACGWCRGTAKHCKSCQAQGWITKLEFDNAPSEVKDACRNS